MTELPHLVREKLASYIEEPWLIICRHSPDQKKGPAYSTGLDNWYDHDRSILKRYQLNLERPDYPFRILTAPSKEAVYQHLIWYDFPKINYIFGDLPYLNDLWRGGYMKELDPFREHPAFHDETQRDDFFQTRLELAQLILENYPGLTVVKVTDLVDQGWQYLDQVSKS